MDIKDISQKELEQIEAYISGLLSKKESNAFEEKLKNEEGFAFKVDAIKTVLTGIETQSLKEQLDAFHEDLLNTEKSTLNDKAKVKSLFWKRIAVAAVFIIAASAFWVISGNSNNRLYAKYYSPDPGLPTTMGNNDNYEFYKAMVAYKQGHYDEALKTWKDQLKNNVSSDTLSYFIGSALLADKKETEAITYLTYVTKQKETAFKDDAYFYLGLAYLKANKMEDAINALSKSDLEDAKDLINKLK